MPKKTDSDFEFNKFLVSEYLKHGSIDKVLKTHHFDLPVSFASYHRVLKEFNIIKSAGPNSKLSESLYVLSLLANHKIPLERIYHLYAPQRIKISINTLHRILHYTRLGLTRRQVTALIITNPQESNTILIGKDLSLSNTPYGKKGDYSLPMGHSKIGEGPKDSITRVLQQEVFTGLTISQNFPSFLVPRQPEPVMHINLADIRVTVYHLEVPNTIKFSSFKLVNLKFREFPNLLKKNLRPGVRDILQKYFELQAQSNLDIARDFDSTLNTTLYDWCSKIKRS